MLRIVLALAVLAALLAPGARAQEGEGPLAAAPADASYSTSSVSFGASSVSASSSPVSSSSSPVSFSNSPVDASRAGISAPSAPVSASVAKGMQVTEEKGGALRFTLNADLLFDFDKANLRPVADEVLRALAAEVDRRLPGGRFRIEGHTDAKGSDKYNDGLSLRRAKSVEAWLAKNARVPSRRMATSAFGKRRPIAPNAKPDGSDDPDGRQKNRRVEVLVLPP